MKRTKKNISFRGNVNSMEPRFSSARQRAFLFFRFQNWKQQQTADMPG